ncbi:MAG: CBS domain-containing protein, partial [archaeon]
MTPRRSRSHTSEWTHRPDARERADKEIAAHYITERFPVVAETMAMGDVHAYIAEFAREFRAMDYIYVVNATDKLVGVISIRDLFIHGKKVLVKSVMQRDIITISPETRREKIARLALEYNLRSIPVIQNKKLVGVVQTHKLLHTINRALKENILTFSGVHHSHLEYDNTLQIPVLQSLVHRLPWLIVGLFGVTIGAAIINQFESIL